MSWPCTLVKSIRRGDWEKTESGGEVRQLYWTLADGREVDFNSLPVGAMWHSSLQPEAYGEPSLCVVLPGKVIWHMHHEGTNGHRWQITGEPPTITAHPSINYVGTYHGWVRDGVVSDDVDGRKFNSEGIRES